MTTELAEFETDRECDPCGRTTLHEVFVRYTSMGGEARVVCEVCGLSTDLDGEEQAGLRPSGFDTYTGPEYEVRQPWTRWASTGQLDMEQLPCISVSGYTVELEPRLVTDGRILTARVTFDGEELSGAIIEARGPGWSVHYDGIGTEYTFPTVYDAMAHAMHYLV